MEVTVRYSAVCKAITGPTHSVAPVQDQTPKSGNSGLIINSSSQVSPITAIKVQPLGSWLRSTDCCTPTGSGGCDGYVNTPLLLLKSEVEVPGTMVKQVDVPLTTVGSVPLNAYVDA